MIFSNMVRLSAVSLLKSPHKGKEHSECTKAVKNEFYSAEEMKTLLCSHTLQEMMSLLGHRCIPAVGVPELMPKALLA